jgi:hypothetical protein
MIKGIFHKGSGLGNQLHRYVGTKVLALDKGEEHTMIAPELFKGKDFLELAINPIGVQYSIEYPSGEVIPESYEGVIDGEFQAESDFIHRIDEVRDWLKVTPPLLECKTCIINFRGGICWSSRAIFTYRVLDTGHKQDEGNTSRHEI